MGLGSLGGGVATTKWLVRQGARVTVTDLKTRRGLAPSIAMLGTAAKKIRFVLNEHKEEDFRTHEYIVVNPGVPKESPYLKIARKAGAKIINDAVLFFEFLPKENPIIAVTGTRGKTTTTNFIAHLLRTRWPHARAAGNTPENPLLKELGRLKKHPGTPAILELSSWQLEYLPEARRAPDTAVITNLYPDHMNRYSSLKEYARAKANIFKNQGRDQALIISSQAKKVFRALYPSKALFDIVCFEEGSVSAFRQRLEPLGTHNVLNFAAALLASRRAMKTRAGREMPDSEVQALLPSLSRALPRFRQEVICKKNGLHIINDSASTSPEAAIAALDRFSRMALENKLPLFFIAGGTDKGLSYKKLAEALRKTDKRFQASGLPLYIYPLEGSATDKICKYLNMTTFKDLRTIIQNARKELSRSGGIIVFSPGAASFEKFKNEFDRGERFTALVKKYF